ncbi:hypothetical protein BMS3Bbin15_00766 [archaeon BMS3Bbin15]|nr:hypothetical protein BMS3Bbin15_00766 [archaeon BMS3Bbin15]
MIFTPPVLRMKDVLLFFEVLIEICLIKYLRSFAIPLLMMQSKQFLIFSESLKTLFLMVDEREQSYF